MIQFTNTLLYSKIANDFLEHLLIYRMQNAKVQKCKIQDAIAKSISVEKMLKRRLQPSMNVSRLPGYTRLEEELEADDLLRSAAVEVDFDRDEVDDEKDWIRTETMHIVYFVKYIFPRNRTSSDPS